MNKKISELELKELSSQLACPTGHNGISVAKKMNKTNITMTLATINTLELKDRDKILELGHGNCGHLFRILNEGEGIHYFGFEVSETMQMEAKRLNGNFLYFPTPEFRLYDGEDLGLVENMFDKIMTVNTLYFWENPKVILTELYRVLKPGGIFVLTFVNKRSMIKLPYINELFKLYSKGDVLKLVKNTEFKLVNSFQKIEMIHNKIGELVKREYTVMTLKK